MCLYVWSTEIPTDFTAQESVTCHDGSLSTHLQTHTRTCIICGYDVILFAIVILFSVSIPQCDSNPWAQMFFFQRGVPESLNFTGFQGDK